MGESDFINHDPDSVMTGDIINKQNCNAMFFLYVLFLSLLPSTAQAYIDPGLGSMLLQGIIAAAVTGMLFFKSWWLRLKEIFCTKKKEKQPGKNGNSEAGPE